VGPFFFKEEVTVNCVLTLCSLHTQAPETNPTNVVVLWIFAAAHSQKLFKIAPYQLGIQYLCTVPQKILWHCKIIHVNLNTIYALKETSINDMTATADCKQTGLHSSWNKWKLGLGGIWATYLMMNFRLGLRQTKPSSALAR
jgi:hypothetical protein